MAETTKTAETAKTAETKKAPMLKSKGIAALVSLFFPGIGLALCNPSRMVEGVVVFIIAVIADLSVLFLTVGVGFIGGSTILPVLTGGACCILTPIIWVVSALGLLVIPVIHVIGAIHTYMRG